VKPHMERNEDGLPHDHPGYAVYVCISCGVTSLRAVTDRSQTCGRLTCLDAAHELLSARQA
jgi:hypothetical protein